MMNVLVIRNEADEPRTVFEEILDERGARTTLVVPGIVRHAIDASRWDGIVVLGGSAGAQEDDEHPWLERERRLLAAAHAQGIPCWGTCLGAQLLAVSLGGALRPLTVPEARFIQVGPTAAAVGDPVFGEETTGFPALSWHRDQFVTPPAATVIARSEQGAAQIFVLGASYGVQCHVEATPRGLDVWAGVMPLVDGARLAQIRMEVRVQERALQTAARRIFGRWLDLVASRQAAAHAEHGR